MIDKIAQKYLELRDAIAELERAHKEQLAPLKAAKERAEAAMLARLDALGAEHVRTPVGTFYRYRAASVLLSDRAVFADWLRDTGRWDAADIRPMKTAIMDMVDSGKAPPPGVTVNTRYEIGFRRL